MKRHTNHMLHPARPHALLTAGLFLGSLMAMAAPAIAGQDDLCDEKWSRTTFSERGTTLRDMQQMHEAAPRGTWRIDAGENGSVSLSSWDKSEVMICAQITAWAPDRNGAERLLRSVHVESSGGRLSADGPEQGRNARWAVSFKIFAPERMDLDVQGANGGISVEGIHGRLSLHTQNGPIQLTSVGGDVEGRTQNGPVSVTLTGSKWQGEGLDVETTNGPVQLRIPDGYSADLTTGTENGPFAGAFLSSMMHRGHRGATRHHVHEAIGSGGAPIRVVTTNGPITVSQGADANDNDEDDDD